MPKQVITMDEVYYGQNLWWTTKTKRQIQNVATYNTSKYTHFYCPYTRIIPKKIRKNVCKWKVMGRRRKAKIQVEYQYI